MPLQFFEFALSVQQDAYHAQANLTIALHVMIHFSTFKTNACTSAQRDITQIKNYATHAIIN